MVDFYPIDTVSKEWSSIPYGYPLANQTFHVLDYHLRSCPVDVPGELFIGGSGLADYYVNDPEKRSLHLFNIIHLAVCTERGSWRYAQRGYIEFLGRKDNQIKIRGHRVELGEIEAVLIQHPELKRVFVMDRLNEQKKKVLCAYYVSNGEISITELRVPDFPIT